MKVKVFSFIENMQDGSARIHFFNSQEAAEEYAENEDCRFNDDIDSHAFEFDEDGNLLNPRKRKSYDGN